MITERSPVVVVMGHIDHGKSTLLDYIRKSNVAEKEVGGITQRLSAYEIKHPREMTFLDTPGHEAFHSMREKGARLADIAVLVVAADDGVKDQTVEALNTIKECSIPFVIAINKIDKTDGSVEKAKQTLAEAGVMVEGYGGTVPAIPISAKTGKGVSELLDIIALQADMEELKGDSEKAAEGYVLESHLDPKAGVIATLIIKNGKLAVGQFILAGKDRAKIKRMENFLGENVKEAVFSSPVKVYGFSAAPKAGEKFIVLKNKDEADKFIQEQEKKELIAEESELPSQTAENIFELPLVLKADTYGALEATVSELKKFQNDNMRLKIVYQAVGPITENDIKLAGAASRTIVLGFGVKVEKTGQDLAEKLGITVVTFDIIYKMSEWFAEEIKKRSPKVETEEIIGKAKILKIFSAAKNKQIVGGEVMEGEIAKEKTARLIRRGNVLGKCRLQELQKEKTSVSKVEAGNQFGALVKCDTEAAGGDILEVFEIVKR